METQNNGSFSNCHSINLESQAITSGTIDASKMDFLVVWRDMYLLYSQLSEREKIWYKASVELEIRLEEELAEEYQSVSIWERVNRFLLGYDP